MEDRQLLLGGLEKAEKDALALIEQRKQELNNWNAKHSREVIVNEDRIAYAQEKLRRIQLEKEEIKKAKDPSLTISYNNQKLSEDKKLRYEKGCTVNDIHVASGIGRFEIILAKKMNLTLIQGGDHAGRPFVKALLEQMLLNAIVQVPFKNFRNVDPKEAVEAMNKWTL